MSDSGPHEVRDEHRELLWRFVRGDLGARDIEPWLYEAPELREWFGEQGCLEIWETDFGDEGQVFLLRKRLGAWLHEHARDGCYCRAFADRMKVGMGSANVGWPCFDPAAKDWSHAELMGTLDEVAAPGDRRWWLWAARCGACRQGWLVCSEERAYDDFHLRRLGEDELTGILTRGDWPDDFDEYPVPGAVD